MLSPFAPRDTGDVQTEDREGADDDDTRHGVDPLSDDGSEQYGHGPCPEIECELNGDARCNDMSGTTDCVDDAVQRASLVGARPPASSDSYLERIPARLGRRTLLVVYTGPDPPPGGSRWRRVQFAGPAPIWC